MVYAGKFILKFVEAISIVCPNSTFRIESRDSDVDSCFSVEYTFRMFRKVILKSKENFTRQKILI